MNEIKRFTKTIENKKVLIECSESLSEQAEFLLLLIEEEQKQKNILQNGFKIQIGWSFYFIEECNGEYIILVPDYKKNPITDKIADVSLAILIQLEQNDMLKKTNIKGQIISFQDTLILLKDALESEYLYLERKDECKEGDSGWYVGLVEDNKKGNRKVEDYIKIHVYELLKFKPQLLQVLALPTGCFAIVNGEEIVEVIDKNNNKIL